MYPSIAVVTNIEEDHLDCYKDIDDIAAAFMQFANIVPFYGALVACIDDPQIVKLLESYTKPVITYGLSESAQYSARNILFSQKETTFIAYCTGKLLGMVSLPIPGIHNVKNSLAAIAVACELGVSFPLVAQSLHKFAGVKRRFEIIGIANNVTVVDDYAHHPSEIRATISAAKNAGYKRVIAVFQPHLYTRTRDFMDDFAIQLSKADIVFVTSIYKSREEPIAGVSADSIVDKIVLSGHSSAHFVNTKNDVAGLLVPLLLENDIVVVMGAGDINTICPAIIAKIKEMQ
jgi:UDP-N-acetylmuramate--alanine ligase